MKMYNLRICNNQEVVDVETTRRKIRRTCKTQRSSNLALSVLGIFVVCFGATDYATDLALAPQFSL